MSGTFLYFAYGSNLLIQRLSLNKTSVVLKAVAKLENYQLKFAHKSLTWGGHVATICESIGHHVWGAVYQLDNSEQEKLDEQEGVTKNLYCPINVQVEDQRGYLYNCRSYQLVRMDKGWPSPHYKDIILRGAKASSLPAEYIDFLKAIPDNGNTSDIPIYDKVIKSLEEEQNKL